MSNDIAAHTLPIDTSSSGDNTLIAGVVGKRIVVLGYTLIAGDIVNVQWKSAANKLSGVLTLIGSTGASPATNPRGVLICNPGESLKLNLSLAIYVGGHLTYEIRE